MDSASNSAAAEHVSRLECLREHLAKAAEKDEQAVCDNHSSTSMPEWALSSMSLSAATSSPVLASSTCQPTAATAASGTGPSACSTPVPTSVAASSSSPLPARDGGGDAPAATVVLLTGDQAQDLIRSLASSLPAAAGSALSGLASGSNGFPASISLHRDLPEALRPRISSVSSVSGRQAQDMSRPPARSLPAAAGAALCDPVLPASSGSSGSACAFNGFASSSSRRDLPETSRPRISCAPRVSRRPLRELSPGLADPTFHGSAISISSSEDEEDRRQAARRKRQKLLVNSNWRESLPSTSSQGCGDENLSPARGPARKRKVGPGRPKGSKNKVKPTSKTQNKTASSNGSVFNSCNICKEKKEGPLCMTDCGHFYHNDCLDSSASNLCSVCGRAFQKTIPFFG